MGTHALIGLGSNLGDRAAHLDAAVAALRSEPGVEVRAVSSYHETAPVGGPSDQGAFLNAAARVETTLDPLDLLHLLQRVEEAEGRVRSKRWGPRTLDLDLLLYGQERIATPELTVPHPWMMLRRFVLAPVCEVAPGTFLDHFRMDERLARLDQRPGYIALTGWGDDRTTPAIVFDLLRHALGAVGVDDPLDASHAATIQGLLAWRLEALRDHQSRAGEGWVVSNFFTPAIEAPIPIPGRLVKPAPDWLALHRLYEAIWYKLGPPRAVEPTFLVVPEGSRFQLPRYDPTPVYRTRATDPEEIVSEIVVAARATRAGREPPAP